MIRFITWVPDDASSGGAAWSRQRWLAQALKVKARPFYATRLTVLAKLREETGEW
jgi:hypothetical protein